MSKYGLPAEMWLNVAEHLDFHSLTALSSTSKYFHKLLTPFEDPKQRKTPLDVTMYRQYFPSAPPFYWHTPLYIHPFFLHHFQQMQTFRIFRKIYSLGEIEKDFDWDIERQRADMCSFNFPFTSRGIGKHFQHICEFRPFSEVLCGWLELMNSGADRRLSVFKQNASKPPVLSLVIKFSLWSERDKEPHGTATQVGRARHLNQALTVGDMVSACAIEFHRFWAYAIGKAYWYDQEDYDYSIDTLTMIESKVKMECMLSDEWMKHVRNHKGCYESWVD